MNTFKEGGSCDMNKQCELDGERICKKQKNQDSNEKMEIKLLVRL